MENFIIDIAIKEKGICAKQKVACEKCKLGKFIHKNGLKSDIDDLCSHEIVFLFAKLLKKFNANI